MKIDRFNNTVILFLAWLFGMTVAPGFTLVLTFVLVVVFTIIGEKDQMEIRRERRQHR